MSENIFSKMKKIFSDKDKKNKKEKEEHDILVEAIEKPVVKEPSSVMVNNQQKDIDNKIKTYSYKKEDPKYQEDSEDQEDLETTEDGTEKKDYKKVYQKYVKGLSDYKDGEEEDEDSLYSSKGSHKPYTRERTFPKKSFYNQEPKEEQVLETQEPEPPREETITEETLKSEVSTEELSKERPTVSLESEERPSISEEQEKRPEAPKDSDKNPSVPKEPLKDETHSILFKPKEKSENKSQETTSPLSQDKKFFDSKDAPEHTGLNRYKNTKESFEFLTKKDTPKPKNKPNFNKVNY